MGIRNPARSCQPIAAGDRAEIGTSFWTALERPDVDEIVDDASTSFTRWRSFEVTRAPKRIRHR